MTRLRTQIDEHLSNSSSTTPAIAVHGIDDSVAEGRTQWRVDALSNSRPIVTRFAPGSTETAVSPPRRRP